MLDPWERTTLRMFPGLGLGVQSGDDWGDPRVPGALRQPSRGLLTQKGCRHGANLPMEEGPGLELRQENRGNSVVSRVPATLATCPCHSPETPSGLCSPVSVPVQAPPPCLHPF